jgi:hypothetical protein
VLVSYLTVSVVLLLPHCLTATRSVTLSVRDDTVRVLLSYCFTASVSVSVLLSYCLTASVSVSVLLFVSYCLTASLLVLVCDVRVLLSYCLIASVSV